MPVSKFIESGGISDKAKTSKNINSLGLITKLGPW